MPALVYLVGMVAMIFTAFSYATLSQAFPVSGSVYGYTSRGINKPVGFVTGWTMLLDYLLVPTLLYVVAAQAMSGIVPEVPALIWGILFVAINTFVNIRGIELTVIVDRVAVVLEILCLGVFVVMGALWIAIDPLSNGFTIQPFYNPETFNPGLVMSAVSLGVLSFLGFDGIATLSEEAKDAKKGPSKAMVGSLLIVASCSCCKPALRAASALTAPYSRTTLTTRSTWWPRLPAASSSTCCARWPRPSRGASSTRWPRRRPSAASCSP